MQRPPAVPAGDLARILFAVLVIGALLGASIWILRPFVGPAIWAMMLVVASWPLMLRTERLLWGQRWLAVVVMTLGLLLLFLVPLALAIVTIVDNADRLAGWARIATEYRVPEAPPSWLTNWPLVGGAIERAWVQGTALGLRDLLPRLMPYAGNVTRWFVSEVGSVGVLLLQILLTVIIAAVMYATGEEAATLVRRLARRIGGESAGDVVDLAGGAIRGVALGVGVTALVQALLGGIGLAVAGVPVAGLLTAVMFMLCIAQLGPLLVLVPAVIWVFWNGDTGWGIALGIWSALAATIDNVIRPLLIRLGADLPLLLIFAGVIGGLFAIGLLGIFVGPVVLAVAYKLLQAWVDDGDLPPPSWRD
ncbi:MAG: AI-2E family transporter YdiK [Rubrivivax sp.]|nr:AI-2E family transporter YdiK [Rubrivivax sp.]